VKLIATTWATLVLLAAIPAGASQQQSWSSRFPLQPGGTVRVENVQGDIAVEAWDRAEVEVSVIKTASGAGGHPEDVRIAVERGEGTLTLRTLYPGQSEEPVRVDYHLRVPRQVRLDHLQTVEGNITVRNLEGSVDARTLERQHRADQHHGERRGPRRERQHRRFPPRLAGTHRHRSPGDDQRRPVSGLAPGSERRLENGYSGGTSGQPLRVFGERSPRRQFSKDPPGTRRSAGKSANGARQYPGGGERRIALRVRQEGYSGNWRRP